MIQTANPQQVYLPQSQVMPAPQESTPQFAMVAPTSPVAVPANYTPIYNNIPYNSLYAPGTQCSCAQGGSPHISTVSIEMNGIQPPNLQGSSPQQGQYMPNYMSAPVGMQAIPQTAYSYPVVGAAPAPVQPQEIAPPPPAIEQEVKVSEPPVSEKPAVDKAANEAQVKSAEQAQEEEAVKPLMEALKTIIPQQGAPEQPIDTQVKAVQTIAQFARVAEASNQLAKTSPETPEAKQTKEKVDRLIKPNLIKEETFMGLADIMLKDTSKLNGEDKKKADQNRIYGMWTLAMLQKLFKEEMNSEAKKLNIPPVSMGEVPGVSQISTIIIGDKQKNTPPDANPDMREAGIAALVNIADPQDKKDVEIMGAILAEAQKDPDKKVKDAAIEATKMYQQVAAAQVAPAPATPAPAPAPQK